MKFWPENLIHWQDKPHPHRNYDNSLFVDDHPVSNTLYAKFAGLRGYNFSHNSLDSRPPKIHFKHFGLSGYYPESRWINFFSF
jgi:hypothetical protein